MAPRKTLHDLARLLDADVQKLGSQAALAKAMGVSATYLGGVIRGQFHPGPKILRFYNLRAERVFVPDEKTA